MSQEDLKACEDLLFNIHTDGDPLFTFIEHFSNISAVEQQSDEEYEKLDNVFEEQWAEDYGWWVHSEGSNMGSVNTRYSVNKHWLIAWESNYKSLTKYESLIDYIYNSLNLSTISNICHLSVSLAAGNNMSLGELFDKYQGNNKIKNK